MTVIIFFPDSVWEKISKDVVGSYAFVAGIIIAIIIVTYFCTQVTENPGKPNKFEGTLNERLKEILKRSWFNGNLKEIKKRHCNKKFKQT